MGEPRHETTLDTLKGSSTLLMRLLWADAEVMEFPGDVADTPLVSAAGAVTSGVRVFITNPGEWTVEEVTDDALVEFGAGTVTLTFPYDTTGKLLLAAGLD